MAWTASKACTLQSLNIKVTKGNGLQSLITESFAAGEFQTSLADGKDLNKAVRVNTPVAALGVTGDYIDLIAEFTLATGTADTSQTNAIFVELMDYTAVPPNVQYDTFGQFSPFSTPKQWVDMDSLRGIDKQKLGIINNVEIAVDATATTKVSQLVRGNTDSRVQVAYELADPTSADSYFMMRLKPNSDGVFYIKSGSIIWAEPAADGFGETGA